MCESTFDPTKKTLSVTKSQAEVNGKIWTKEVKTSNARRRVQLGFSVDELDQHRSAKRVEGRIFCDTDGGPIRKSNFWRRSFTPILKGAGLPADTRFHDLRHRAASLMLMAGIDIRVVAEKLGHGSPAFKKVRRRSWRAG